MEEVVRLFNRIVCLLIAFVVFGCGEETSTDESVVVADPDMGHSSDQGLEWMRAVPTEDMRHPASDMGVSDAAPEPDVAPPMSKSEATNDRARDACSMGRAFYPQVGPLELHDQGKCTGQNRVMGWTPWCSAAAHGSRRTGPSESLASLADMLSRIFLWNQNV